MNGLWTSRQINRWSALVLLSFGSGLLLGRLIPPLLWSLALVVLGLYLLGRRRVPGVAPLLLLFFFGTLIVAPARFFGSSAPRGEQVRAYTSTPEQAQDWSGAKELAIRNSSGTIEVSGGEAFELRATYYASGNAVVPGSLITGYTGAKLSFTGVEPSLPLEGRSGVRARLHARVPRQVALEVSGRMGDVNAERLSAVRIDTNIGNIRVREVAGVVSASSDVGDVFVSLTEGGVEVHTQVGDVYIDAGSGNAPVLAQTDVGDITLVVPPDADAHIIASSLSRGLPPEMTRRTPTEGELTFGRGTRPIVLKTRIGAVHILRQ